MGAGRDGGRGGKLERAADWLRPALLVSGIYSSFKQLHHISVHWRYFASNVK